VTKRFYPTPVPKAGQKERESLPNASQFKGLDDIRLEDESVRNQIGAGYDPYDTVPNVRHPGSSQRHADLRMLSEWIRAKRQADKSQKGEADPASTAETLPGNKPFWPRRR
jgi:hypothetical protein